MITLHEAYLKAKNDGEKNGLTRLLSCRDYGAFWGFHFTFPTKNPDGIGDITINKRSGELNYFIPPMDLDLAMKSIPIAVEQFAEYNVAI